MAIPEEFLAELRDRVDIVDVIGGYVRLRKSGSNYKALCPFHKEKTPSFMVNRARGIYKCFGCGASGNVITFVMETQNVGFLEAVRTLASQAGMTVPSGSETAGEGKRHERLYEGLEFAAQQFEDRLWKSEKGAEARAYIEKRGISVETARAFRLGYADGSGAFLVGKSRGLGVWDGLLEVGAVIQGGRVHRDMFRNRLIFPIMNASGRVVGFGGRSLDGVEPKYLNSRESSVFRKGSLLYGLGQSKASLRKAGRAVLVEGYMDVLSLHQAGIPGALASAGTAMTDRQAGMLKRYTDSVVVAFDGDEAGRRAARRSLEVLLSAGLDARVAPLEEGSDPDSVIRAGGARAFSEVLDGALDVISFVARGGRSAELSERETAIKDAVSLLNVVPDPIRKEVLIQRASDVLGVPEQVLVDGLKAIRRGPRGRLPEEAPEVPRSDVAPLEKEFLRALLLAPELLGDVLEAFDPSALGNPASRRLFEMMADGWKAGGASSAADLMDRAGDPATRALIGEVAVEWEGHDFDAMRAVYDCMRRLRERKLRRRLEVIKNEIRHKEATGLYEELGDLALQLQQVTDELQALARGA